MKDLISKKEEFNEAKLRMQRMQAASIGISLIKPTKIKW